ncbi:hypothetical protein QBC43DRAFT_334845 [Cladorrhinum sp. PSN259]|nr:hypothetical protein QBC43DRAFT_334845 [Cladorrhinum sp. PSN259]
MRFLKTGGHLLAFAALFTSVVSSQELEGTQTITDPSTGIVFQSWNPSPDLTFGIALPPDALTVDATEFIGYLSCKKPSWCGLSLGGGMVDSLLILAYPSPSPSSPSEVLTSFRWASDYTLPTLYSGDARLTKISSRVNSTAFELLFRCRNCLKWVQEGNEGTAGAAPTSEGFLVLGWAHAASPLTSSSGTTLECADNAMMRQHEEQGIFGAELDGGVVQRGKYDEWVRRWDTGREVKGSCAGKSTTTTTTTTPPPTLSTSVVPARTSSIGTGGCQKSYTAKAGDYCWLIATENGLTLDGFLGINPGLTLMQAVMRTFCAR